MNKFQELKMKHDVQASRKLKDIKLKAKIENETIYIMIDVSPEIVSKDIKKEFTVFTTENQSKFPLPIENSDEPVTKSDLLKVLKLTMPTEENEALREEYERMTGLIPELSINTSKKYIVKTFCEDGVIKIGIHNDMDIDHDGNKLKISCPIEKFFDKSLDLLIVGRIDELGHSLSRVVQEAGVKAVDYININKPLEIFSLKDSLGALDYLINRKVNIIS